MNGSCQNNPGISCSVNGECTGRCSGRCSEKISRFCNVDTECRDDYGFCTADSCMSASSGTCAPACDDDCASSVIKYIRGYDRPNPSGGHFRIRHTCNNDTDCPSGSCRQGICSDDARDIEKTRKLGDIIYSSPKISPDGPVAGYTVRYNDETYREFTENVLKGLTPMVIIGANDGMVHAFKLGKLRDIQPPAAAGGGRQVSRFTDTADGTSVPADLGHEQWAYIPYNVLPYLRWYCEDGYCHIPMLDARFTILDASIHGDASAARGVSSWRRLLVGTMGLGGKKITLGSRTWSSSIFVIDITDPLSPVLKWERPLPDHTLTSSNPAIVRLGSRDTNGSWYLVMGSGPENILTDKAAYKTAATKIFIIDLRDGTVTGKDIPISNSAVGDLLAADLDSDYQVDDVYFGTYGLFHESPTGALYRLRIKDGNSYRAPANWSIEPVVDLRRPVFAAPEIAQDEAGNIWLYFGTGLYLTLQDAQPSSDSEFLTGCIEKEDCWRNGCSSPYDEFLDVTETSFENAQASKIGCFCEGTMMDSHECSPTGSCSNVACGSGESTAVLEVQGATLAKGHSACNGLKDDEAIECLSEQITANYHGWRRKLVGEKMFSRPFVAGGLANFTTFAPGNTPCSPGGTTSLVSVHYVTGTPYIDPEIALPGGTSGSYNSITILPSVSVGAGIPPLGESLVSLPLPANVYKVITQVGGGLPGTTLQPSVPYKQGYVLWITK